MSFLASFVNDQEKKVNPVHVVMVVLILAIIVWGSYIVYRTVHMPDLQGAAELLGTTGLANLAHKAEDIASAFNKDASGSQVK
jgi:hypothetical protein